MANVTELKQQEKVRNQRDSIGKELYQFTLCQITFMTGGEKKKEDMKKI